MTRTSPRRHRTFISVSVVVAIVIAFAAAAILAYSSERAAPFRAKVAMLLLPASSATGSMPPIAHGGGTIDGVARTNTIEAMRRSYELGFRYFELDFLATSDGHWVGIHDWTDSWTTLFDTKLNDRAPRVTLAEFERLRTRQGWTPVTAERLAAFLDEHQDAMVVSDVKDDNIAGLRYLSSKLGARVDQVIPQIYDRDEYLPVRHLGFGRVILTVYRMPRGELYDYRSLVRDAEEIGVWALTMPEALAEFGMGRFLLAEGIPVYAHTINDARVARALLNGSCSGIYSDTLLIPEEWRGRRD